MVYDCRSQRAAASGVAFSPAVRWCASASVPSSGLVVGAMKICAGCDCEVFEDLRSDRERRGQPFYHVGICGLSGDRSWSRLGLGSECQYLPIVQLRIPIGAAMRGDLDHSRISRSADER